MAPWRILRRWWNNIRPTQQKRERVHNDDPLLELIPRLSSKQKAFRQGNRRPVHIQMYRLRREPKHLEELDWDKHRNIVIWRENGTLICVGREASSYYDERRVTFVFEKVGQHRLNCAIFGKTDAAIAETATWFWCLRHPEMEGASLHVDSYVCCGSYCDCDSNFELAALSAEALKQILDANPSRRVCFPSTKLSPEQSVILATRPYLLHLKLTVNHGILGFQDEGNAFVDALEKRQSPFGSLILTCRRDETILSRSNMKRILGLDWMIQFLKIGYLNDKDLLFLPFSAKVNALSYKMKAIHIQPGDFDSLDIVAKDLDLTLDLEDSVHWKDIAISFSLYFFAPWLVPMGIEDVVPALIDAMKGNEKLKYLDLRRSHYRLNRMTTLVEDIFRAMEEHPGLRTVVLDHYPPGHDSQEAFDADDDSHQWDFSPLERLLKRNQNIVVCDERGQKFTNKGSIDKLYALNRSAKLSRETTSLRPLLLAKALTDRASANFQYTAQLLSNHEDILCEFIRSLNLDSTDDGVDTMIVTDDTSAVLRQPMNRKGIYKVRRINDR